MINKRLSYLLMALLALSVMVAVYAFFGRQPQTDYRTVAAEIVRRHGQSVQPIARIARKQAGIIYSKSDKLFYDSDNKLYHGIYTEQYKSMNTRSSVPLEAGRAEGEVRTYARNGRLRELITYQQGLRSGAYFRYDAFGHLLISGNYHNNLMEGEWKLYFPDGSVRYIATYEKGKLREEWYGEFPADGLWKNMDKEWIEDE